MLCGQCRYLFKAKYQISGPPIRYSRKIVDLLAGSDACQLCAILYEWLPKRAAPEGTGSQAWHSVFNIVQNVLPSEAVIRYGVKLNPQGDNEGWYILQIAYAAASDLLLPPQAPKVGYLALIPVQDVHPFTGISRIEESSGDISALDQAHHWLSACLEQHQHCKTYARSLALEDDGSRPFRPTRLIQIRPKVLRLHETANSSYRYVALSHRWPLDSKKLLQLTTANYHELLTGIPQSSGEGFSKVFADAVKVCRRLGVEYIWIDSLCIVQSGDGGVDWRHEATRMGDVYKYSLCCIAAESVKDPDEALQTGMFRLRDEAMLEPITEDATFDVKPDTWGGPRLVERLTQKWKTPKPGRFHLMPTNDWYVDISNSPLSRRGWVEQERLLSPRILHFTSKQIYFDCYQVMATEVWPQGHPTYHKQWDTRPWTTLKDLALFKAGVLQEADITPPVKLKVDSPLSAWYRIAYPYARTDFTRTQDKLIAISGLARSMLPYLDAHTSDYLAGVWKQSLPYGLLWYTPWVGRPDGQRVRPHDAYQAPTWSWASVNWLVMTEEVFHQQPHDQLVTVEGSSITPVLDDFGEVKPDSYIMLRGTTYRASLSWGVAKTNYISETKYWPYIRLGAGVFATCNNPQDLICPDERYIEGESQDRKDLRVLPILKSKAGNEHKWVQGLILEPTGDGEGRYRRFGYVKIASQGGKRWFELNTNNVVGAMLTERREEVVTIF